MDWANRPNKALERERVFQGHRQHHGVVVLPGWDENTKHGGYCVRTGLEMGSLDPSLPLYAAEREPEISPLIEHDLRMQGFQNVRFHHGDITGMRITGPIDTVFLDFMGGLSAATATWMADELAPRLVDGARVCLTVAYNYRINEFMREAGRLFQTKYRDLTLAAKDHYRVDGKYNMLPLLVLRSIFANHVFAYERMSKYADSIASMLFIPLGDFQKLPPGRTNGWPTIHQLIKDMDMTSEAAKKAWETRRGKMAENIDITKTTHEDIDDLVAKGIITKGSGAAYKAHITRGAGAQTKAARKAWDTRRAMKRSNAARKANETRGREGRSAAAMKAWETRRAKA